MSLYALQRIIWDINRNPDVRRRFFDTPEQVLDLYDLSAEERGAMMRKDYRTLYRLGVHGLLLRPFSILHAVSEEDYLNAIRAEL